MACTDYMFAWRYLCRLIWFSNPINLRLIFRTLLLLRKFLPIEGKHIQCLHAPNRQFESSWEWLRMILSEGSHHHPWHPENCSVLKGPCTEQAHSSITTCFYHPWNKHNCLEIPIKTRCSNRKSSWNSQKKMVYFPASKRWSPFSKPS